MSDFAHIVRDAVKKKLRFVNENREALLEAWIAKTGLSPDQAKLVQQEKDGLTHIWVEENTDRCMHHRSDIAALRTRLAAFEEVVAAARDILKQHDDRCYPHDFEPLRKALFAMDIE